MILADTSIWIDHLRDGDEAMVRHLERGEVLGHPWVTGELSLGHLRARHGLLALLRGLPAATVATDDEITTLIERHRLYGRGIGYVDAGLVAATALTTDARLWTRDKRLTATAATLGLAYEK